MRTIFVGLIGVALFGLAACTSSGGGSVTAPSAFASSATTVGAKPTEAPCSGCSFTAVPQGQQLRLNWSGFIKGNSATCEITTSPASGTYSPAPCDEGTMLVSYPLLPTTYTLTVYKNQGNDPPQSMDADFHGPVGTFAGPTTAAVGHNGLLTVVFGAINGNVHDITATWTSNVPGDDDPGVVYVGGAVGTDESLSVNAVSATRCSPGEGSPQATFSATFTVVDANTITGNYNGSACHPTAYGTFSLTRQ